MSWRKPPEKLPSRWYLEDARGVDGHGRELHVAYRYGTDGRVETREFLERGEADRFIRAENRGNGPRLYQRHTTYNLTWTPPGGEPITERFRVIEELKRRLGVVVRTGALVVISQQSTTGTSP